MQSSQPKKKIMVFGTFDGLHPGHYHFLQEAKKMGDYLIVVIARDITVKRVKGNKPLKNELRRKEEIIKTKLANKVILGNFKNPYKVIKDQQPNMIVLGYDQKVFTKDLRKELKKINLSKIIIKRLDAYHPEKYKSSLLRKK